VLTNQAGEIVGPTDEVPGPAPTPAEKRPPDNPDDTEYGL